jgi:hypothetical protein
MTSIALLQSTVILMCVCLLHIYIYHIQPARVARPVLTPTQFSSRKSCVERIEHATMLKLLRAGTSLLLAAGGWCSTYDP